MRNRAIEIFLDPLSVESSQTSLGVAARPEASMQRYQNVMHALEISNPATEESQLLHQVALDNLSWSDMPILSRFLASVKQSSTSADFSALCYTYTHIYETSSYKNFRAAIGDMLGTLAKKTNLAPADFRDAQVSDRAVPFLIE
jgi:hypothetical protein